MVSAGFSPILQVGKQNLGKGKDVMSSEVQAYFPVGQRILSTLPAGKGQKNVIYKFM